MTNNTETIYQRVETALEQIRPYLESDGGDVKLVNITDDYTVQLELLGNCESCPMSAMTLKAGVEETIKRLVPEIKKVEPLNTSSIKK